MSVVTSFTEDQDFWELNPQLLVHSTFKELYKKDKTKDKSKSSKLMWWVALCHDLDSDNKWRGYKLDEKRTQLGEELLGDATYYQRHQDQVEPIIAAYCKFTDSPAKRALREWELKMEERALFIKNTGYTMGEINEKGAWVGGTAQVLDAMMANTKKLYDSLGLIQKQLSEESIEGAGKGGSTPSAADEGKV